MKVQYLSTRRDEDCGISEYTSMLEDEIDISTDRTEVRLGAIAPVHYFTQMIKFVRSDADVLHVQHEYGIWGPKSIMSWFVFPILVLFRLLSEKPVIMTFHSAWSKDTISPPYSKVKLMYVIINNIMLSLSCDHAFFLSEETKREFEKTTTVSSTVLSHGVYSQIHPLSQPEARDRLNIPAGDVWCLPGFIRPVKGHDLFVELAKNNPDKEFVVGGGTQGQAHVEFEEKLKQEAPDNVTFTGVLNSDEFHWLFSAVDLAVLPYRTVSQSGILNMCAAYNLPTVTTDLDRFSELEDNYGWPQTLSTDELLKFDGNLNNHRDSINAYKSENGMEQVITAHMEIYG